MGLERISKGGECPVKPVESVPVAQNRKKEGDGQAPPDPDKSQDFSGRGVNAADTFDDLRQRKSDDAALEKWREFLGL